MRMEELSNSRYIKGTDTVERYLLNLVQEYFKNNNTASESSREYIIKKAVDRMKEEISFDNIGVLSITLPNGEEKSGAINISLEDLNGEPLISPKLSAFNVNFGSDKGTACEGNDPRLSDARTPLEHEHEIDDIIGLKGVLSTLNGKLDRIDGYLHEHDNKNILDMLVYTGDNDSIDLTVLETLEDKINTIVKEIEQEIITHKEELSNSTNGVTQKITTIEEQLAEVEQVILETDQKYYNLSQQYADEKVNEAQEVILPKLKSFVTKAMLAEVITAANSAYTLAGSMQFDLGTKIDFGSQESQQSVLINISSSITKKLTNREQKLENCIIEMYIIYTDPESNEEVYGTLPYIIFNDDTTDGSIQLSTVYSTNQLLLSMESNSKNVPQEIQDARILYKVYSKQNITLA